MIPCARGVVAVDGGPMALSRQSDNAFNWKCVKFNMKIPV